MPLPKPANPQTLAAMKKDVPAYETAKAILQNQSLLIDALGPGDAITAAVFSVPSGISVSAFSGSLKRGRVTFAVSPGASPNPNLFLAFPKNLFTSNPFAQVTRSGGSGALSYSYSEAPTGLTISLIGSPVSGTDYTFNFTVQE